MGRVITTDSPARDRKKMMRYVLIATRHLMLQEEVNETTRDMVAFIAMALIKIFETVELTVTPWEKRGYWIKADRFRMEWHWAKEIGEKLSKALINDDWLSISQMIAKIVEIGKDVQLPKRQNTDTFWKGSWGTFLSKNKFS